MINPNIVGRDGNLLKEKGHVWHKSSMNKGIVSGSGIDNEARWGFSDVKR